MRIHVKRSSESVGQFYEIARFAEKATVFFGKTGCNIVIGIHGVLLTCSINGIRRQGLSAQGSVRDCREDKALLLSRNRKEQQSAEPEQKSFSWGTFLQNK